jgi:hypothetical protein
VILILTPLIGTIVRLYIPITLGDGREIYTDLDTGAEYNIVSKEFAIKTKLLAIPFSSLTLKGVALDRLRYLFGALRISYCE